MHLGTFLSFIPSKPIKETKKIFETKQQQDINLNYILERNLIENLDNFLKNNRNDCKEEKTVSQCP